MVDARARRLQAQTLTTGGTPPPTVETDEDKWARIAGADTGSYSSLRRT